MGFEDRETEKEKVGGIHTAAWHLTSIQTMKAIIICISPCPVSSRGTPAVFQLLPRESSLG